MMDKGKGDNRMTEAERNTVLVDWNQTDKALDLSAGKLLFIHQLFEQQAQQRPDATALVFRDQSLSYAELNSRANQLAERLHKQGAKPDALIGIFIERSIEMLIGLFAILKSGAAYVPLDPTYPSDRIALMLEDSQAGIILTHASLLDRLPKNSATVLCVDAKEDDYQRRDYQGHDYQRHDYQRHDTQIASPQLDMAIEVPAESNAENMTASSLAYVIYTSGSTGMPKGVMVEHRNVINFMSGMDDCLNYSGKPGVWLAVTSISFDISVLELFWSLTRGFKVVIQEQDAASLGGVSSLNPAMQPSATLSTQQQTVSNINRKMDIGLFYFSSDAGPNIAGDRYKLLLEGAKFADTHEFSTVWTPERHFHLFGGLYPNPSVTSAAVAAVTENVAIRAGSIVLPLHNTIRVAEEWSVVDNLSNGRVGFSFASGWHVNDFALKPENFENRRQIMFDEIETVRKLWRGESITVLNGEGQPFEAKIYPPAIQKEPPIWITTAGNIDTFRAAGEGGFNVLTNLLGQSIEDLSSKISAYRQGRKDKGYAGQGNVSVMVHTFIGSDVDEVRERVREPFCHYLKTSFDLVKIAPWAFPAFKQPSKSAAQDSSFDADTLTDEDMDALIEHAFDRYFETAGLFGTPTSVLPLIDKLKSAGIDELACLIDFGVNDQAVLDSLKYLNQTRINSNPSTYKDSEDYSIAAQIKRHGVTHFQCTPSMARILISDDATLAAIGHLDTMLLGGEALPIDLAKKIHSQIKGTLINVYGPTETTIWSTSTEVTADALNTQLTIGRPIANTQIYIVDEALQPTAIGVAGELMIGGQGVVRGYHRRPELTAEKFIANPFINATNATHDKNKVIYRTGDLAKYHDTGDIEFLGRLDHQVKIRGYRIELGEIEYLLNQCEGIKDSVVIASAEETEGIQQLLAYVVADKSPTEQPDTYWQSIWDQAYAETDNGSDNDRDNDKHIENSDPTFNVSGWIDSYTGEPHLDTHMHEWVDTTVERIMALKPKRVLEIGCGTGLLLYRIAPQCDSYVGVDFSDSALTLISQQVNHLGLNNVTLIKSTADHLSDADLATFDLVIINSVVQYFPSSDYLLNVLQSAVSQLAPNGNVFIGDVRHLALKNLFDTSIEFAKAPDDLTIDLLQHRIKARQEKESELLIAPDFFNQLKSIIPRLNNVDIQLKRGNYRTEMSAYRYDVLLQLGESQQAISNADFTQLNVPNNLAEFEDIVSHLSEPVVIRDCVNARLVSDQLIQNALELESSTYRVDRLKQLVNKDMQCAKGFQYANCFQPEAIYQLKRSYAIALTWAQSGDPTCFDVYFYPKDKQLHLNDGISSSIDANIDASDATIHLKNRLVELCNQPTQLPNNFELINYLKTRLQQDLPEFMVPNDFIILDTMPLTPNGKINRKALPKPEKRQRMAEDEFVAPESDIEKTIATVFQEMLNLEKIGTKDDFFSLGANSLLIAQANNRLNQRLESKVSLVAMYRYPTIATLASYLSGNTDNKQSAEKGEARAQQRKSAAASRRRRKSIRL